MPFTISADGYLYSLWIQCWYNNYAFALKQKKYISMFTPPQKKKHIWLQIPLKKYMLKIHKDYILHPPVFETSRYRDQLV